MQVRYEKVGRTGKNRFTGEQREPIDKAYYICQTYNRLGKNACTSHKIEARDLYNLVLNDIQELAKTALKDADAFYQRLSSRMERRYLLDASQTQKECQRLESRNREIDEMFLSLYTDKAKGILTEQRFMKLTATLEQEQEINQKRLQDLMLMMRHSDEQENEVRTFIKEIRRYAAIEELDEAVLNRLISKILVGEVKKIDGQKCRKSESFITLSEKSRKLQHNHFASSLISEGWGFSFCKISIDIFIIYLQLNSQSNSRKMMTKDPTNAIMFAYRYDNLTILNSLYKQTIGDIAIMRNPWPIFLHCGSLRSCVLDL